MIRHDYKAFILRLKQTAFNWPVSMPIKARK